MDTILISEIANDLEAAARQTEPMLRLQRVVLLTRAEQLRKYVSQWQPIDCAPRDNKRPLYLAQFSDGKLTGLSFDGSWQSESESWEMPQVYYYWDSNGDLEEPTHWAYQDEGPPPGV